MEEIDKIKSQDIIILPNNSNIATTVKQLIELSENNNIHMVNTSSIQQGIASIFSYDQSSSYESNIKDMEDSLLDIEEAFVTVSTRDVVFDGKNLKKDDFFSTINVFPWRKMETNHFASSHRFQNWKIFNFVQVRAKYLIPRPAKLS